MTSKLYLCGTGGKLLGELAAQDPAPVYVRVHNLLTTGDGSASLKWGSTGRLHRGRRGKPGLQLDDTGPAFDTFQKAGVKPLVEIGFMPEALSTRPEPYRHNFRRARYTPAGLPSHGLSEVVGSRLSICPSPARALWRRGSENLAVGSVERTRHRLLEREHRRNISNCMTSAWPRCCDALPKHASAVRIARARPIPKLRSFYARFSITVPTNQTMRVEKPSRGSTSSAFIRRDLRSGWMVTCRWAWPRQLAAIEQGFQIVASFPEWRHTPIILGESDPDGCAACSARNNPQNSYRKRTLYAAYTAETLNNILFWPAVSASIFSAP